MPSSVSVRGRTALELVVTDGNDSSFHNADFGEPDGCPAAGYGHPVLIKWITCRAADRTAFGHGQQAWARLHGLPGFLGQGGGWSRRDDGLAHIIGCWTDRRSYQTFMDHTHDPIATAQAGTYSALEVRLFEHRLNIGEGFPAGFVDAALLRIAHCHIRTHRRTHFVRAQAEVWNPGMAAAPGLRGGAFAERGEVEFLVLSLWRSVTDHEHYLNDHFPGLREKSGAVEDLNNISGDSVELEPAWTVTV